MSKFWRGGIIAVASVASLFFGYKSGVASQVQDFHAASSFEGTEVDSVLDGDTVVIKGEAIKVKGIDTPELGPWAKCWAEALAAGFSRSVLEEELHRKRYTITERRTDSEGRASAKFIDSEGFDLSDPMSVHGGAALTDGKWNWCGDVPKATREDDKLPRGPNLWWPANHMYDERAAD